MTTVKYRSYDPRLRPRRTRLEVPGWTGQPEPRADGSHEYPWHCVPFCEAARAGLELCFPYEDELRVSTRQGELVFETSAAEVPPFRSFGREYFTYQSSIDLKVDPAHALKVETHPRFYTDTTGTVPIAVPALLRAWWPMVNFLVFKSPAEGATHVFRPGEPFVMVTVVPAEQAIELVDMPEAEAGGGAGRARQLQSRRIHASRSTLSADTQWTSSTDTVFDGTYRRLSGAARSVAAGTKVSNRNSGGGGDGGDSAAGSGDGGGDDGTAPSEP